jgi:hypothetical protein
MNQKKSIISIGLRVFIISIILAFLSMFFVSSEDLFSLFVFVSIFSTGIILAIFSMVITSLLRIEKKVIRIPLIIITILFGFLVITNFSLASFMVGPINYLADKMQSEQICYFMPVTQKFWKNDCFIRFAYAKKDPAICDKISDTGFHNMCYKDIAVYLDDESICDKIVDIVDQEDPNHCRQEVKTIRGLRDANY